MRRESRLAARKSSKGRLAREGAMRTSRLRAISNSQTTTSAGISSAARLSLTSVPVPISSGTTRLASTSAGRPSTGSANSAAPPMPAASIPSQSMEGRRPRYAAASSTRSAARAVRRRPAWLELRSVRIMLFVGSSP